MIQLANLSFYGEIFFNLENIEVRSRRVQEVKKGNGTI